MAAGSFSVPLEAADFIPAGVSRDRQRAACISPVRTVGFSKSVHIAKNKDPVLDVWSIHIRILLAPLLAITARQ